MKHDFTVAKRQKRLLGAGDMTLSRQNNVGNCFNVEHFLVWIIKCRKSSKMHGCPERAYEVKLLIISNRGVPGALKGCSAFIIRVK
jgi:hypothetical protein